MGALRASAGMPDPARAREGSRSIALAPNSGRWCCGRAGSRPGADGLKSSSVGATPGPGVASTASSVRPSNPVLRPVEDHVRSRRLPCRSEDEQRASVSTRDQPSPSQCPRICAPGTRRASSGDQLLRNSACHTSGTSVFSTRKWSVIGLICSRNALSVALSPDARASGNFVSSVVL